MNAGAGAAQHRLHKAVTPRTAAASSPQQGHLCGVVRHKALASITAAAAPPQQSYHDDVRNIANAAHSH